MARGLVAEDGFAGCDALWADFSAKRGNSPRARGAALLISGSGR